MNYEFFRDGDSNLFLRIEAEPEVVEVWWKEWKNDNLNYNDFLEFLVCEKKVHAEHIHFYSIGWD